MNALNLWRNNMHTPQTETRNSRSKDDPGLDQHLSDSDFNRLSGFIHSQYGINLPPAKKSLLEGRLRKRMKHFQMMSFRQYCDYLFTREGMAEELIHMIDAVTTNKTDFFREPSHFTYLTEKILPELMKLPGAGGKLDFVIWSAACSSGEEPYTMAMVLSEYASQTPGMDFSVFATDISTKVLSTAQQAIYDTDKIEPIPMGIRKKYLLRSRDPAARVVRIAPELRQKVTFRRMNLMDTTYSIPANIHAIFCRNVLIYFDAATQERLIRQFCNHLVPGGHLFMGHAETLNNLKVPLQYVAPTIYRKVETS